MNVKNDAKATLDKGGAVSCPAQIHRALINITALIAYSVLNDRRPGDKAVRIPPDVCTLIGEILLWETKRISRRKLRSSPPRDRVRMETYELLGRGMRALTRRSGDEGRCKDGRLKA